MVKASDNEFPSVLFEDQVSDPSTPASGFSRVYTKADGAYVIDDAGGVTGPLVDAVGGGGVSMAAGQQVLTNETPSTPDTYEQWGTEELDLGDLTGETVTVMAWLSGYVSASVGGSGEQYKTRLQISLDGGSTWGDGADGNVSTHTDDNNFRDSQTAVYVRAGSATGNIQVRAQVHGDGTGVWAGGLIVGLVFY